MSEGLDYVATYGVAHASSYAYTGKDGTCN